MLRPRILDIRHKCIPGSKGVGRVAFYQNGALLKRLWEPDAHDSRIQSRERDQKHPFTSDAPSHQRDVGEFYRAQQVLDRRIHIIGMGAVGRFMAHSLRGIPNPPPVTLLYHRREHLKEWEGSAQKLQVITDGDGEKRDGFDAELAFFRPRYHGKEVRYESDEQDVASEKSSEPQQGGIRLQAGESAEPINSLIVCTKTPLVLQALSSVKHRLHKESVVFFLQNGMGMVEQVNREIFPDEATRPQYMLGINTHGMHRSSDDPFTVVHAGFGTISLGLLPRARDGTSIAYSPSPKFNAGSAAPVEPRYAAKPREDAPAAQSSVFKWTPNNRYLLRTLLRTPSLCATAFSPPDLLQLQLEKLAINSVINPLTVMLDARNGAILYNYALTRVMRLLLSETSLVIRSLPELAHIPNVQQRFDPGRLETMIVSVAHRTRDNISSMLADVRNGEETEIEYMNEWIVKKGEEQGVRCFMNYMMANLVKGKGNMVNLELGESIPLVEGKPSEGGVEIRNDPRQKS